MTYSKPEMIRLDGMRAAGLCRNGSTASDDLAKCASGGIYTSDSCHWGISNATGGCFEGSAATGLNCAGGYSASAGSFPPCSVGGDYQ